MVDLILNAIPAFVLLLVVEVLSFHLAAHDDDTSELVGYEAARHAHQPDDGRSATSFINVGWKAVVLGDLRRRSTSCRRCGWTPATGGPGCCSSSPTTSPTTGTTASSHEMRVFWASHVVHHSSQHYNLSTALRQTWTPMTALPFWAPLALLGFAPWMILLAMSWKPDLPVLDPHRADHEAAALVRVRLQHALATTASTTAPTSSTSTATTAAS